MREKIQSPIGRRAFLKGSGGCLLAAGAARRDAASDPRREWNTGNQRRNRARR